MPGGVIAFCRRWAVDAEADGVHPGLLKEIVERLTRYSEADSSERERLLRSLFGLLDELPAKNPVLENIDLPGADNLSAAVVEGKTADSPETPISRRPVQPDADKRSEVLERPLTVLKGVGVKRAEQYSRLGLKTIADLIWHLPHRHEDFSRVRRISDTQEGQSLSVVANLRSFSERRFAFKRDVLQAFFNDGSGEIRASWWNQSWIKRRMTIGKTYLLSGVVGRYMGHKTLENPVFEEIGSNVLREGPIFPVYGLSAGLRRTDVGRHVQLALKLGLPSLRDPLPESLRRRYSLVPVADALRQIHSPKTTEKCRNAQRRLAFDELFHLQLGVQRRRQEIQNLSAAPMAAEDALLSEFKGVLVLFLDGCATASSGRSAAGTWSGACP